MNSSGAALRAVLDTYGVASEQNWLDFDTAYNLAQDTPGMMSGAAWYHWVGIRGVDSGCIWVANSAPGTRVCTTTSRATTSTRLGGFSVVWLV